MAKSTHNIFYKKPEILLEMLTLRRAGLDLTFLAELYNCDRASLRYQCRKYQVFPVKTVFKIYDWRNTKSKEIFNPKRIAQFVITQIVPHRVSNWMLVDGERVNTGKSYADYLAAVSPYNKPRQKVK